MLEVKKGKEQHRRRPESTWTPRRRMTREERRRLQMKRRLRKRRLVIAAMIGVLLCIVLAIAGIVVLVRTLAGNKEETTKGNQQARDLTISGEAPQEEEETQPPVSITVSAVGDCILGTDVNFNQDKSLNAYYNSNGAAYFLQNVKSIFEADDLTIVNMEGTLTESNDRRDKEFAFKGPGEFTQILTSGGVEAANLANNHIHDYGEQGYTDTINYMEQAGITTFGYERTAVLDVNGVKVGLVGTYELALGMDCEAEMIENIKAVENEGAQVVIVSFHWGQEKVNYPDDNQKALAHSAIDNGADLVLGHHPHVLQGIEEYKGENIVYSLGNFCYGGSSNPVGKDTMIFQQTFTVENGELVEDNVTNIIPCSVSSASDYNNYQPTPLDGSEKERILQAIEEYSSGLQ